MSDGKIPTLKEFFAPHRDLFTGKWDKELFDNLCKEYKEISGIQALDDIAYSMDVNKYSLEERLAAFDKIRRIRGDNDVEGAQITQVMRDMVVGFYNMRKADSEAK